MCNLELFRLRQCTVNLYTQRHVYIDNYIYKYMQSQCTEYIFMYVHVLVHVNMCVGGCAHVHIYKVFSAKVKKKKKKAPAPCIVAGLAHCKIGGKIQRSPGRG